MLQKQPININFGQGLDTKTDPNQVQIGKFLVLNNMVFDTLNRLTKRNGNKLLTTLPSYSYATSLTTLNDNLIATGTSLFAYSEDTNQWLNQGSITPVNLSVLPLVRISTPQSKQDSATASNGLVCVVYVDSNQAYFSIRDSVTGQQVLSRQSLPSTAVSPRVFVLGNYFIVTFLDTVSGSTHLQYVAISTSSLSVSPVPLDIATNVGGLSSGYDGLTWDGQVYFAWSTSISTQLAFLDPSLAVSASVTIPGHTATLLSLCANSYTNILWVVGWDGTNIWAKTFSPILAAESTVGILSTPATTIQHITGASSGSINELVLFIETYNTYPSSVQSDYVSILYGFAPTTPSNPPTSTGSSPILRSVGLASKAFTDSLGTPLVWVTYAGSNQPTYFLIDNAGNIFSRLAYSNGGGYIAGQTLPSVSSYNGAYQFSYLFKDFLTTVNKTTIPSYTGPSSAIYSQTGINLASFTVGASSQYSSEIASALHLTGGQLWEYDGVKPVEHGFHVWPEDITVSTASGSGGLTAQQYYYQFTYEWTDNQGLLHRSAPSIPITVTTTTSNSTNTFVVPTLRLTYKIAPNPVRIVGYRWSVAQQVYYQFTSVTSPTLNNPTIDYVTIVDSLADSAILGNALLYTTGGVVENIAAPANIASCLFKNRLFLIDAEDQNLLWYSKQVIEAVPVEMSDLLTLYVAPTTGTQGSTGPCTSLSAMDDKLIIFKRNAAYYITGTGPDNTGANNDFSDPIFITSAVGCPNPNSIVLMQNGLMFQTAGKGIWLLGRDLSTNYIGAPVEAYNGETVLSAQSIPGTNQVRFILGNNTTLVYDYYVGQWGTFNNIAGISSTIYQQKHSYLNSYGQVYQESPGIYLDGSNPVLMGFTTSWISVAGLQGYERLYQILLLGNYFTPFKLNVQLSYDYNSSPSQATLVTPDNYGGQWGSQANWGAGEGWGGTGQPFQARVFPQIQKCETFQVSVNEIYDPSFGVQAGQGLALSGMNLLVGVKKGSRNSKASRSFG
jgi:hypothetical protein